MSYNRIYLEVGIFSALALVLLVTCITLLASGSFFKDNEDYVLYFQGSVSGLSVGAPVVFRGVPLGRVMSISLEAHNTDDTITIPVSIEILGKNIRSLGGSNQVADAVRDEMIRRMVEHGLRARIAVVSYLTGQARIELDFFPETPIKYRSMDHRSEIPTLSSPLEEFSQTLFRINIDKIAHSLLQTLDNLNKVIASEELWGALVGIKKATDDSSALLRDLPALAENARKTLQRIETAADRTAQAVPRLSDDLHVTLDSFSKAAERTEKFFSNASHLTSPNAATIRDIQNAVKELAEAARAVRGLANTLERSPESLLRGKGR